MSTKTFCKRCVNNEEAFLFQLLREIICSKEELRRNLCLSKTDKRLIRATLKTYDRTGTYVFLKMLKKAESEYKFQQRISLTAHEFENLIEKSGNIRSRFTEDESTKRPTAKKPGFQQKFQTRKF